MLGRGDNSNEIYYGVLPAIVALSASGETFMGQLNIASFRHQQDFGIFFVIMNFLL